jgi:hypothetical protein
MKVKYLVIGLILGLIGGYLYTYLYPNTIIEEKVEIKYKYVEKTVYLDKPIIRNFILPEDTLYIPTDTAELIARYREIWTKHNTRNFYQDTFKLDTFGYFVSNIQVIRNQVDSLSGKYELKIPEKTITKFVYPKNSLYIGGLIGKENISPSIMFTRSGKYNYYITYNLVNNGFSGGILIKIK